MSSTAIKDAKNQLRKTVKSQLQNITQSSLSIQSNEVLQQLNSFQPFINAKRIALYMNMPHSEIQTMHIIKACFDMGKKIYLPKCMSSTLGGRKKNHLRMLEVKCYEDVLNLMPQGKYKLLEPVTGSDIMEDNKAQLDVIIVPGVAFTVEKQRIGHGAGFYDEYIKTHFERKHTMPHLIGIGLREQLVNFIPKENHDRDLDSLIIADKIY